MPGSRWSADSLAQVHDDVWRHWRDAAQSGEHPLRLGILATRSETGVSQRTLVLRDCDARARTIMSYTDVRSLKVAEIRDNPHVSWLFYDTAEKVQIRVTGVASIHVDDELADACWASAPAIGKLNNLEVLPPGTEVEASTTNLPAEVNAILSARGDLDDLPAKLLEGGRRNFCVLVTRIDEIDWLRIRDNIHQRCHFVVDAASGEVRGSWLTP